MSGKERDNRRGGGGGLGEVVVLVMCLEGSHFLKNDFSIECQSCRNEGNST